MRDLRCFQLLLDRRYDDAELASMLDALAKRTSRQRAAFFGPLLELLWSDEPAAKALHARALGCIADGDGHLLVEVVVAALARPDTRDAAMSALRQIASHKPARFVHAMFHSDEAVRALALASPAPGDARDFEIFALADPNSRDVVLARGPKCAREGIGAVLGFLESKIIDADRARALLDDVGAIVEWLKGARCRSQSMLNAFWRGAHTPSLFDYDALEKEVDDVDVMVDLFWDAPNEKALLEALTNDASVLSRAVVAMLLVARRRAWSSAALVALFEIFPGMIGWTFLPEDVRRRAVELVLARPLIAQHRKRAPSVTQPLLYHAMCIHPDRGADLRVCSAIMRVTNSGEAARELARWIGEPTVLDAIQRRPAESAAYFTLLDKDDMFKKEVYFNLPSIARDPLVSALVRHAPLEALPFLAHVDSSRLNAALGELVNQEVPSTRARALAQIAVERLDTLLLNDLFFRWRPRLPASEEDPSVQLGFALLFAAGRGLDAERFVATMSHTARTLPVVLGVIDENPSFPYGKEIALANALRASPDPFVRRWALSRLPEEKPTEAAAPPTDEALARALVTCKRADLAKLVEPYLRGGRRGLAGALARRTDNPAPDARVCAALLASVDSAFAIDALLVRYGSRDDDDDFLKRIERELASSPISGELSLLGHAAMWRWEKHGKAFLERALDAWGDLPNVLKNVLVFEWRTSRRIAVQALADSIAVMCARDKPRAARLVNGALVLALVDALETDVAPWVCDALLAAWRYSPALLAPVQTRVRSLLIDLDDATRDKLGGWIDTVGLPKGPSAPVVRPEAEEESAAIARVRATTDVAELARACTDPRAPIVQEAALRLIDLGEPGRDALAALLEASDDIAHAGAIAESIALWDEGAAVARARRVANDPSRAPHVRYAIAVALLERGEKMMRYVVVECMLAPAERPWFRPEDWTRLTTRLGFDQRELSIEVAASPQPHAYVRAIGNLLTYGHDDATHAAMRQFLDEGTLRMGSLRRAVAEHLHAGGDFHGFPIVFEHQLEATPPNATLLAGAGAKLVSTTTLSFLAAGNNIAKEGTLLFHLARNESLVAKDEAYETILMHCASDPIRQTAALAIRSGLRHLHKLIRVAETFAWGARMGQELLGKLYRVQMTGGQSLGHTFLQERKIWVTPLPILRGDRHGREIVEALILHEFGHHLYHRGKDGLAVWQQAEREGLQGLLNLVADEHLERNLRALDPSFGDRLKRLAAYAFQHTEREINVRMLLGHLGAQAFGVLTSTHLGVARDPNRVVIESGALLFAMERQEMAFSRFMRSLRMGLGNRHDDPLVARALELFDGSFRHKTMRELMDITHKLRDIFGWQVELVKSIGPHETLEESPKSEEIIWGEGITQEEVDRMVERVLDPKSREGPPPREGSAGRPVINIAPKNDFDRITTVERMPFDATQHRDYARKVARPATMMRRYLEELGLHHVPQPGRLRGSRFDRSRTVPLVVRNEPRVLLQRELQTMTDLFIGIVIDCSGSMATRDNMERARQFGMLLAEACAGLTSVDLRVFGFTDKVIYDCGEAKRCAAYGLRANGGNNDAAALFFAANVAKRSRRRAKLLIMISDGLPTECSVDALRELVNTLGRRHGMVCAQVAVQPLAEVCFPHYVVCNDPTIDQTVMRFGRIVMNLVRRAITH